MVLVSEKRLGKRSLGRLKIVLQDNIKMDFKDHKDLRIIFNMKKILKASEFGLRWQRISFDSGSYGKKKLLLHV